MRHSPTRLAALALCLAATSLPASLALAQARIEDCEKIQAADAYNQCLAKFGPTSKVKSVEPVRPGDVKDSGAEAAAGASASGPSRHGRHAYRGRSRGRVYGHRTSRRHSGGRASGHRKRATFDIKQE
ncbi:hypothetical protein RHAL1_03616 [Beijerinckiaceae bacterium RH AL1]|nr:hypothetical protein [Beijerinckiaceae bacterium]VVB49020.1 hypothetical protein RHCH11_RHCH11_03548 [Beijerinckiaceae bacterium RH CH11]VVB49099.1 hypothetical protein RHAL8_03544 [Beijerinckiaceae bacterium RH AL8]VVC56687.1 hypothetical protein RHAL1_03616 [Beijerinckiaceae bacterium RH AL1]